MPSPSSPSRNRSRSRSPDRRQRSSGSSRPRAPKQLDIYKRPAGGGRSGADPLDRLPPRGSTGGASDYRRSTASLADEGDYRSRADRRAGREDGGSGGRAGYHSGGGRDDDRRGGYGGDDRDRRTGGSDRYRDDDCRRGGDDRDSRGGGAYGRPQERDGPPPAASSSSSLARPTVGQTSLSLSSSAAPPAAAPPMRAMGGTLIEIIANDRLGRKVRVKCSPQDTVGDLKKLIAAQSGTDHRKIQLKKSNHIFKNHITLYDYEINDGMSLELY